MAPNDKKPASPQAATPEGDRIAKVLSRRGVSSRREAERMIEAGEVTVNGKIITSPALNVTSRDRITISGHPLPDEEPARLWLYYKPEGLVTSEADEKGRDTVFDHLPPDMPRVMSIGRLDLNSEGLLLLTNDGELKRKLELPSTGWLRKYRVRINGNPSDAQLEPLRKGITVEGDTFQPMQVSLDRIQGANAWLTIGLREGKNREIRRALNAIDLYVNRLIRTSYGPFRLNDLKPGEVEEIRPKVLRDQLGEVATGDQTGTAVPAHRKPGAKPAAKPSAKPDAPRRAASKPREGDGVRTLARAWTEAVTPEGRPARPAHGPAKTNAKPTGKPVAKTGARPAPKTGAKPGTKPGAAPARKAGPSISRGATGTGRKLAPKGRSPVK